MAVIHLIRHAEPTLTGVLLGRTDPPLAREDLSACDLAVNAVYSSPLRRARRTAELLFPGRDVIVDDRLAERDMGDWDGLAWEEIERRWPVLAGTALADWVAFVPPGAEPWTAFLQRVEATLGGIRANAAAAVVAHAGVNAILWQLLGGGAAIEFQQSYGEIFTIEY